MGSPCPANLTGLTVVVGTVVDDAEFTTVRDSINAEFTRRGLSTSSWIGYVDPIDADVYNEMRNELNTKLGGVTPPSPAPSLGGTVAVGEVIKASGHSPASMNDLIEHLDEWKVACICDCNYCTCDCNYCTCDCNYCTCDCNYCTCDCNYCTCNCNYCTCNCNHCPCNCNYCTCNCAWSK